MTVKKLLRGTSVAACLVAGAMTAFAGAAQAQEKLKVGVVAFYTGAAAGPFGIPARNAAELIVEAINAGNVPAPYNTKGAGGMEIEAVYIDEAGGTTKQVTEYRNMVQRQGVDAVIGYISSGSCLAVAPVAEELKTFTILFDCGTPRIFEDSDYQYVFRTSSHATMDSVGAARYIASKFGDTKTFQGINQNYAWGQDSWRDFDLAMGNLMPDAKAEEPLWPKIFQGQYGAEISRLSVSPPQVLHTSFWGGDLESFILQSSARSLHKRTTMLLTTGESVMHRLGRKLPDGVVIGARGPYGVLAEETELSKWLWTSFSDRFGTPPTFPSYHMAQAFIALKIAYDNAAASSGGAKPSADAVADGLRHKTFEAFGTTINMKLGKGHQAITPTAYGITKWDSEAGEQKIVDVITYPAECVNPPADVNSVEWIEGGMQGAKC
ncbi:ABC transporter substrate-binding protein [Hwanghaeella sp.]|uniref:ABC transporter substrate-binding protein n=1 Tax=Hwanghaeella sp. TaxID=2605943 RepID=UPI003CCBF81C